MTPSRRMLLQGLGGLTLGFVLPGCRPLALPPASLFGAGPAREESYHSLSAWVQISPSGSVVLRCGASEMGQGVLTALPMILAEELDLDWRLVRTELAPAHPDYRRPDGNVPFLKTQSTSASMSVRSSYRPLREAGAAARALLVRAAADRWGVSPRDCHTELGAVLHGEQRLSYGELAEEASAGKLPKRPALKAPADFRILGQSLPRLDIPMKVDGSAQFGVDVALPDQLCATLIPCPILGGRRGRYDRAALEALPGVTAVHELGEDLALVGPRHGPLFAALKQVEVEWLHPSEGPLEQEDIDRALRAGLDGEGLRLIHRSGRLEPPLLEAEYSVPYLEHLPLEPLGCTVWLREARCLIIASTQSPGPSRAAAAEWLGWPVEQVELQPTLLGGGFGRRSETDFILSALEVASHYTQPVKMIWSREACFARGYYRPRVLCRQSASWSEGRWTSWGVALAGQNVLARVVPPALSDLKAITLLLHEGMVSSPYSLPRHEVSVAQLDLPVPIGFWRSVAGSHNGFFRECFVDEVAHALGEDPGAFRLRLLEEEPRQRAVLQRALEIAGPPPPDPQGRGVALFESFGSICAQVMDVSVVSDEVQIHAVFAVIDCGRVLHPDTVKAQVMGSICMGLSASLGEAMELRAGRMEPTELGRYPLLSMRQSPERVEVELIESEEEPGGVGEPGLPPTPAALCNAIFQASGKRIRELPLGSQLRS